MKNKKYIFVTGGVLSSIGKGISAASIGMLMESRGIKVTMLKMDPYLNVDPGTMNPLQHGEVFVLDDGAETDLDLGHYSRFVTHASFTKANSFTTGKVYESVIRKEREGKYLGQTVQVIPHITDEIKSRIREVGSHADLVIVEVGGTVGDIESQPFLEAIRQMKQEEGSENVAYVHLTLVPFIASAEELKTKPTQHSVKELREMGIQPDILICRSDRMLPPDVRSKIGLFCSLPADHVFSAIDAPTIYQVPLLFHEEGLDDKLAEKLGIWGGRPDLDAWKKMVQAILNPKQKVKIGIVGKYVHWKDSYKSLSEALVHGGVANQVGVEMVFIDSEQLEKDHFEELKNIQGLLVPGGFGSRGIEGKIKAIQYARENKIPYFGICLGMQLAVIEFARHVVKWKDAHSSEFESNGNQNVIDLLESQKSVKILGGTMRLGLYSCTIKKGTKAYESYRSVSNEERHRHRYEVSNKFRAELEKNGLVVSGQYINQIENLDLVEIIELENHPWFLACQFHPEFLSQPLKPHPLFQSFIEAAKDQL